MTDVPLLLDIITSPVSIYAQSVVVVVYLFISICENAITEPHLLVLEAAAEEVEGRPLYVTPYTCQPVALIQYATIGGISRISSIMLMKIKFNGGVCAKRK